ncbi:hypothetical protein [Escherichia coli]|uniref:hypothetical protein n=1 Tax=Escherichia coli TaxID=562 RepID=UPI003D9A924A
MEAACQPARKPLAGWRLPETRGAAPAALPARLSGQKVVYGCMPGTGVMFRDAVTVSSSSSSSFRSSPVYGFSGRPPGGADCREPASLRRTRWRGFGLSLRSDA